MKTKKILTMIACTLVFWCMLLAVACTGGVGELRIDAPESTKAELGTYAVPSYDVVDEEGTIMAGYTVSLVSVKDAEGNEVPLQNGQLIIEQAGLYYLEYAANGNAVKNVIVCVDFADRTPPTIKVNAGNYPELFLKGHTYNLISYSYSNAPDLSKCFMKLYYVSPSGEKTEKQLDGVLFTVTEKEGKYDFLLHAEDAVGNVAEYVHSVPVAGPETLVEGQIAYFDDPFGARELNATGALGEPIEISYNTDTEYVYGEESGSTKITMADTTNYAMISLDYPVITDLSNYDTFTVRVFNAHTEPLQFGYCWTAYKKIMPQTWTEFTLPTSYFRNHGKDVLTTTSGGDVYEDDINGLRFVVMNEKWAQNGDVPIGTTVYLSAMYATKNDGPDLKIDGESYNYVCDKTEYELDTYSVVNRANVALETDVEVVRTSAYAPDGSEAQIEDGKLKFTVEGVYTLTYEATYTGEKYEKEIQPLTVRIINGGSLKNVEIENQETGKAVYSSERYGLKQIHTLKNVAAENTTEYSYGTEGSALKFTILTQGVGDVTFNTEMPTNINDYDAIVFNVLTVGEIYRVYATYGENGAYLGGDQVTAFEDSTAFTQVVCYIGNKNVDKLGIHFFNKYGAEEALPAGTVIYVSDIRFEKIGYQNLPQDETVNIARESSDYLLPVNVKNVYGRIYNLLNVTVTKNEEKIETKNGVLKLQETGEYIISYLLHDKTYSYVVSVIDEYLTDVTLTYKNGVNSYTVEGNDRYSVNVTEVELPDGSKATLNGNTFALTLGGQYTVRCTVNGKTGVFQLNYLRPQNVDSETAVYLTDTFATTQTISSQNVKMETVTDASKGKVAKITVLTAGTGMLVFNNVFTDCSQYDYVVFDVKIEDETNRRIGITNGGATSFKETVVSKNGWTTFAIHIADYIGAKYGFWQTSGLDKIGLYLFNAYGTNTALPAGTVYYVTNIRIAKGEYAPIQSPTHNLATEGTSYTFPTTVADQFGGLQTVTVQSVKKGDETVASREDGAFLSITLSNVGEYSVYYTVGQSDFVYTLTVIDRLLDDVVLYYNASVNAYLVPDKVGNTAISLVSVQSGTTPITVENNSFTLGSGNGTTEKEITTYVYTVSYTANGKDGSYTVTYYRPSTVISARAVYLDTDYGRLHQVEVENATMEASTDTPNYSGSDFTASTKLTVKEDGVVWLHFKNVPNDTDLIKSMRFAIKSNAVLRFQVYNSDGLKIGNDGLFFSTEGNTSWTGPFFNGKVASGNTATNPNVESCNLASFSVKLFKAYNADTNLAAGTVIYFGGVNLYTFA